MKRCAYLFFWAIAWTFVLVFVICVVSLFFEGIADAECHRLGYARADLTLTRDRYCIRRVNQTDEVVSLDSARRLVRP
jgi:hypothetical protein